MIPKSIHLIAFVRMQRIAEKIARVNSPSDILQLVNILLKENKKLNLTTRPEMFMWILGKYSQNASLDTVGPDTKLKEFTVVEVVTISVN